MRLRAARAAALVALLALAAACGATPGSEPSRPRIDRLVRSVDLGTLAPGALALPNARTSVKFAVIGDSGRGTPPQYEVAAAMERYRERFAFAFVLMVGDNIYEGPASPQDYEDKFAAPYRALLDKGVRFYAVLGNHDDPRQVSYEPFHMNGQRYYTFAPPEDPLTRLATRVEFFALDSTQLDDGQLRWLDERLRLSDASWKIAFLHHPLYTSGRYRTTARAHRWALEPLLVRHQVDAVFSGHEHIYQRTTLQNGIQYFVTGGAGSLRRGDGVPAPFIARTFDDDYHFMLVEIEGQALHVQAIARTGATIDAASVTRGERRDAVSATAPPGTAAPR